MNSSTSTNSTNSQPLENPSPLAIKPIGSSISQLCSVKLDRNNFLLWESSILPVIRGHKLEGYIMGTKKCPEEFVTEGAVTRVNPAWEEWIATNQLLLGWIYNTLTSEIASQLIGSKTSNELWIAVRSLAGAHTRSRVTLLKGELHRTRKGSLKMTEYLSKMKLIFNNLLLAGSPIPMGDLIIQTLAGLDIDYNPITVQLSDKHHLTWVDLQAALLTYESRLEQLTALNTSFQVQANIANHNGKSRNTNDGHNSCRSQHQYQQQSNRGGRSPRGRGWNGRNNNSCPVCQVCGKVGHTVAHCYFRFDQSYMGTIPSNNTGSSYNATTAVNNNSSPTPHPAYLATASTVNDPN